MSSSSFATIPTTPIMSLPRPSRRDKKNVDVAATLLAIIAATSRSTASFDHIWQIKQKQRNGDDNEKYQHNKSSFVLSEGLAARFYWSWVPLLQTSLGGSRGWQDGDECFDDLGAKTQKQHFTFWYVSLLCIFVTNPQKWEKQMAQNKEQRKDNRYTRLVSFLSNCCILWFRFYLVDFVFFWRVFFYWANVTYSHTHTRAFGTFGIHT